MLLECPHCHTASNVASKHICKCRQDIKLDIYDWKEAEGQLETKWRVSGIVQLPWRPLLAAAGGTTHVFSQVLSSCCISAHSGNVLALFVLRLLLKAV